MTDIRTALVSLEEDRDALHRLRSILDPHLRDRYPESTGANRKETYEECLERILADPGTQAREAGRQARRDGVARDPDDGFGRVEQWKEGWDAEDARINGTPTTVPRIGDVLENSKGAKYIVTDETKRESDDWTFRYLNGTISLAPGVRLVGNILNMKDGGK